LTLWNSTQSPCSRSLLGLQRLKISRGLRLGFCQIKGANHVAI
jgi:hypothetical protein